MTDAESLYTSPTTIKDRTDKVIPGATFRHYKEATYTVFALAYFTESPRVFRKESGVIEVVGCQIHDTRRPFVLVANSATWALELYPVTDGPEITDRRLQVVYASHAKQSLSIRPIEEFVQDVAIPFNGKTVPRFARVAITP